MKRCPKCGDTKPVSDFYRNKRRNDGVNGWCKPCHKDAIRKWSTLNTDRRRAVNKAWNRENAAWIRARERHRKYGLEPDDVLALLQLQGGVCAMGGEPINEATATVDHDHTTGRVRGLLCRSHNAWLGHVENQPNLLKSMYEYLANPPARRLLNDDTGRIGRADKVRPPLVH